MLFLMVTFNKVFARLFTAQTNPVMQSRSGGRIHPTVWVEVKKQQVSSKNQQYFHQLMVRRWQLTAF